MVDYELINEINDNDQKAVDELIDEYENEERAKIAYENEESVKMTIEEIISIEAKEIIDNAMKCIESEESYRDLNGDILKSVFIGTCFNIMPSGKYYMPFACSNVEKCSNCGGKGEIINSNAEIVECPICHGLGSEEAYKDQVMQEALENYADKYGAFVHSGEGDPCDMFVSIVVDEEEDMEMEE